MTYDSQDAEAMALCAWKEARGAGEDAMRGVMHVIKNRAMAWNESVHAAVYAKNQFTSMSVPSDPQFNLSPCVGDSEYSFCLATVFDVLSGEDVDPTNGALYYANLPEVTSGWFVDNILNQPIQHPQLAVIRELTFFA